MRIRINAVEMSRKTDSRVSKEPGFLFNVMIFHKFDHLITRIGRKEDTG